MASLDSQLARRNDPPGDTRGPRRLHGVFQGDNESRHEVHVLTMHSHQIKCQIAIEVAMEEALKTLGRIENVVVVSGTSLRNRNWR